MPTKILIVEDERLIARDIQQRLEGLGYEVVAIAGEATTALNRVAQYQPDLVLMDMRLKDQSNGITAAIQIRDQFQLPVVFLTAHADPGTLDQAKAARPFGYLVKPVKTENLQATIEIALIRHQTEAALQPPPPCYAYQVGGSLSADAPSYVVRPADRALLAALTQGQFCYIFNSRQMGKSSLRVRTKHRLEQAGYRCAAIDLSNIGSEMITPMQWYKGIASELWRCFDLMQQVNFKQWWQEQADLAPIQLLSRFIEDVILVEVAAEKLFIFIDEIDSVLSLNFPVDDFFALIRYCYNHRAQDGRYSRLTFALFGVATPSDLIQDRSRTPFNIGQGIELQGFQPAEVQSLIPGLAAAVTDPEVVLTEILQWTGGQPFLTQKLCRLIATALAAQPTQPANTAELVAQIVQQQVIDHWEAQDEPEHLKTIRDRLLRHENKAGRLLTLYQNILHQGVLPTNDSTEQEELLLSGLVMKHDGHLWVRNLIYRAVFHQQWVNRQLASLRPYVTALTGWQNSQFQDDWLLRGQALQAAQRWAAGKHLSPLDEQFLTASQQFDQPQWQPPIAASLPAQLQQAQNQMQRLRLWLVGLSVALVIAIGFGLTQTLGPINLLPKQISRPIK